ncbi:hypothetical protein ACT6NV_10170 [Robiginitalea sp. IMCC44478]|uniref:hypothetical protein n=1 Tax=Robiginitalea sp. IMCC44478 TaxID=3459122 RepID=UPI0040432B5F
MKELSKDEIHEPISIKYTLLKLVMTVSLGLSLGFAGAQERYRVTYDYASDNIQYLLLDKNNRVTDTLAKPRLKRHSLIEIKLTNINPFAVQVETDVKEENLVSTKQGFNFSSLLGGIQSFTGNNLNLNVTDLPDNSVFKSSRGESRGAAVNSDFREISNTITTISAMRSSFVADLLNPKLGKNAIEKRLIDLTNTQVDARLPDPNQNFHLYLAQLEKTLLQDKSALEATVGQVTQELESEADTVVDVSRGALTKRRTAIGNLEKVLSNLSASTQNSTRNIDEIKSLYTLLEATDFEQTYDYAIEADEVNIELKFVQSDFSDEMDKDGEKNTLKTRNIKLYSKGGFKINSSIALTLNNFGTKSKDYFVDEEGTIGADNNDYFVPNLSTMINFYPFLGQSFNIGGSFGLSIPIGGEDAVKGVNFLLGPSLFFGSKSRLALSGGVAYGPVQKLTNGLQVGDTTSFGSVENFTKTVYDFGYYFGISFSLFDIK